MAWYNRKQPKPTSPADADGWTVEKDVSATYGLSTPGPGLIALVNGPNEEAAAAFEGRTGTQWFAAQLYVHRCVSIIANALTEARWALYADAEHTRRIEKAPSLDALNKPNPYQDGATFKTAAMHWLLLNGNAYVYNHGSKAKPELYLLPANLTRVIPNDLGWPDHYEVTIGKGAVKRYELKEVTHLKLFSTTSQLYGMSVVEALRDELLVGALSRRTRKTFWQNNASPGGILTTDKDQTDEEATKQVKRWVKLFRGPDRAGKTAALSGGWKYAPVGIPPKDAEWLQQHDVEAKDICVAFGVPYILLEMSEAKYATAVEVKKTFWHETVLPLGGLITIGLSSAPWAGGFLDLDTSKVEALADDTDAQADRATRLYMSGILTLNQTLEKLGEPTLGATGEVYLIPSKYTVTPKAELGKTPEPAPPQEDPNGPQDGNADGAAGQSGDAAGNAGDTQAPGSVGAGDKAAHDLADALTRDAVHLPPEPGRGDDGCPLGEAPGADADSPAVLEPDPPPTLSHRCRIYEGTPPTVIMSEGTEARLEAGQESGDIHAPGS